VSSGRGAHGASVRNSPAPVATGVPVTSLLPDAATPAALEAEAASGDADVAVAAEEEDIAGAAIAAEAEEEKAAAEPRLVAVAGGVRVSAGVGTKLAAQLPAGPAAALPPGAAPAGAVLVAAPVAGSVGKVRVACPPGAVPDAGGKECYACPVGSINRGCVRTALCCRSGSTRTITCDPPTHPNHTHTPHPPRRPLAAPACAQGCLRAMPTGHDQRSWERCVQQLPRWLIFRPARVRGVHWLWPRLFRSSCRRHIA
jgi:hypothetical protein